MTDLPIASGEQIDDELADVEVQLEASETDAGVPLPTPAELAPPLRASSTMAEAIVAFHEYMVRNAFSQKTSKD